MKTVEKTIFEPLLASIRRSFKSNALKLRNVMREPETQRSPKFEINTLNWVTARGGKPSRFYKISYIYRLCILTGTYGSKIAGYDLSLGISYYVEFVMVRWKRKRQDVFQA